MSGGEARYLPTRLLCDPRYWHSACCYQPTQRVVLGLAIGLRACYTMPRTGTAPLLHSPAPRPRSPKLQTQTQETAFLAGLEHACAVMSSSTVVRPPQCGTELAYGGTAGGGPRECMAAWSNAPRFDP
eukprot:1513839-Rhodomonas_salina.2